MHINSRILTLFFSMMLALSACTYNPLLDDNHLTGNVAGATGGAIVGAGLAALFMQTKPVIIAAGVGGASIGYYLSTLRSASAGILAANGEVYKVGEFVGIEVPTDNLFEPNTDEFLPNTRPVLESIVSVLQRYPRHNILISGNMSGFGFAKQELRLSESRARQVAAYLWMRGISNYIKPENLYDVDEGPAKKLIYVGFGNYFPIANNIHAESIRENSRIQITAYPPWAVLYSRINLSSHPSTAKRRNYKDEAWDSDDAWRYR